MNEETKPIPNHPGYGITRSGRVWSYKTNRWRKLPLVAGYFRIFLSNPLGGSSRKVSHLVLETFRGPCPLGMVCRHLDGKRLNDSLNNLTWGTYFENEQDKIAHGTRARGEKVGAKLTGDQVREIRRLLRQGFTGVKLAIRYQVDPSTISNVNLGKTYKEVQ